MAAKVFEVHAKELIATLFLRGAQQAGTLPARRALKGGVVRVTCDQCERCGNEFNWWLTLRF